MNEYTIVFQQGPLRYLVVPTEDLEDPRTKRARVLDVRRGVLYPEVSIQSVLKEGYWMEFDGDQSVLVDLMKQVGEPMRASGEVQ